MHVCLLRKASDILAERDFGLGTLVHQHISPDASHRDFGYLSPLQYAVSMAVRQNCAPLSILFASHSVVPGDCNVTAAFRDFGTALFAAAVRGRGNSSVGGRLDAIRNMDTRRVCMAAVLKIMHASMP
jgi:hypothetical protein